MSNSNYAGAIKHLKLANGFEVYLMPVTGRKALSFSMILQDDFVSVAKDPKARSIASVTAETLLKGSSRYTLESISQTLEQMCIAGATFRGNTQNLSFATTIVTEDFPKLLDILTDALITPQFNHNELEIVKNQSVGYCLEQKSDTGNLSGVAAFQTLYSNESMYYPTDSETDIASIKQVDALACSGYLDRVLHGRRQLAIVVGDFDYDSTCELLNKTLGNLPVSRKSIDLTRDDFSTHFHTDCGNRLIKTEISGKSSTDIKVVWPMMLNRASNDFEACLVACNILGGDTMSSRLGKRVRVKEGLTYGITASFGDASYVNFPLVIEVTVNPKNVAKALGSIDSVVQEFLSNGITQDELDTEVNSMVNATKISRRTVPALCKAIQRCLMQGLDLNNLDNLETKLRGITLEQVQGVIAKYFKPAYDNYKVTSVAGS